MIVNGDITQCDLPSGVKSGLSDAMSRFEEDEMIGVVRFTKRIASARRSASAHYKRIIEYAVVFGKPGFVCAFYPSSRERVR